MSMEQVKTKLRELLNVVIGCARSCASAEKRSHLRHDSERDHFRNMLRSNDPIARHTALVALNRSTSQGAHEELSYFVHREVSYYRSGVDIVRRKLSRRVLPGFDIYTAPLWKLVVLLLAIVAYFYIPIKIDLVTTSPWPLLAWWGVPMTYILTLQYKAARNMVRPDLPIFTELVEARATHSILDVCEYLLDEDKVVRAGAIHAAANLLPLLKREELTRLGGDVTHELCLAVIGGNQGDIGPAIRRAVLSALAIAGNAEDLNRFERWIEKKKPVLIASELQSISSFRERIALEAKTSSLLRPAVQVTENHLLRPASMSPRDTATLLRPASDEENVTA